MPTVWIPTPLRDLTNGQDTAIVTGSTIRQVIEALDRQFPGMKKRLCNNNGLRPGIAFAVGTEVANLGLIHPVPENSEVHILNAIGGGGASTADDTKLILCYAGQSSTRAVIVTGDRP